MIDLPHLALSVRQPWAFCLAAGWKPVENRSWRGGNPGLSYRGPFAIHASSGMTRAEYEDCAELCVDLGFNLPPPAALERGGIVGVATIVDVVTEMESGWFFGPKGLVIADARSIDFIPVGGRLGFFDWRALLPHTKTDKPVPPAKWMQPARAEWPSPPPSASPVETQGRLF